MFWKQEWAAVYKVIMRILLDQKSELMELQDFENQF